MSKTPVDSREQGELGRDTASVGRPPLSEVMEVVRW